MARLLKELEPAISIYRDRRFEGGQEQFEQCLRESTTLYIGNLSFYTTEDQIYEVFSKCGDIKRIIMGLDKNQQTPCGFCFVVYYTRPDAEDAVKYLNGTTMDERPIRVDFDWGFREGRQFGRGRHGGQVRDEYREDFDAGRGGYGQVLKQELTMRQKAAVHQFGQNAEGLDVTPPAAAHAAKRQRFGGDGGSSGRAGNPRFREADSDDEDAR